MSNSIQKNDDFFCFPSKKSEDDLLNILPESKKVKKRKTIMPIVPKLVTKDKEYESNNEMKLHQNLSFDSICDFSQESNFESTIVTANEMMLNPKLEQNPGW